MTKGSEKKGRPNLIGLPFDPDNEHFARMLDSHVEAGRKIGWNECFRTYVEPDVARPLVRTKGDEQ